MKPAFLLVPALACVALAQQGAVIPPAPPSLPDEEDVPEVIEEWDFEKGRGVDPAMLQRLRMMVPLGRTHEGLRYPVYSRAGDGKQSRRESVFDSKRVTRTDEDHLLFEGTQILSFEDLKHPDRPTRRVSLSRAIYSLKYDILYSDTPSAIEGDGMSIRSRAILHDRATDAAILHHAEIYDLNPEEFMKPRHLIVPVLAAASILSAQDKKPADPKVPAVDAAKSAINSLKQDERNIDNIKKEGRAALEKLKKSEAAKRELDRIKDKSTPTADELKARLEKAKEDGLDENALKELRNATKDFKGIEEDLKKALKEKLKKEGAPAPAPSVNPNPESDTSSPGSFDSSAAPEPLPVKKAPNYALAWLIGDKMVKPPSRDPNNPEKVLPKSDPRTRLMSLTGTVRLRRPDFALDADEADILMLEGEMPGVNKAPDSKPGAPVDPGKAGKEKSPPFERIVARGRVRIMFVKDGIVQIGRGGYMIYEAKTGIFTIRDWPEVEAQGKLFKGPSKDSVLRLGDLQSGDPTVQMDGFKLLGDLEKELTPADVPKTPDTAIPSAGALRSSTAPSPAPR